jgi:DNA polymerase-3 subunit alpha
MKAYLYLDTETTGLSSSTNEIIQLACVPLIDGKSGPHFNEFCQPTNWNSIDQKSIEVHGIAVDQMKTFQSPYEMLDKFIAYVSQFGVKFVIAGYNSNFDKAFIGALFARNGRSKEYSRLFLNEVRDVHARAKAVKDKLQSNKLKLVNLAEEFGIEIKAHDALSDIQATIEVDRRLSAIIGEDFEEVSIKDDRFDLQLPELPQLHIHSEYSNTDSVTSVEEWVYWAYSKGVKAVAFPDHNWAASLYKATNIKSVLEKVNKAHKLSLTENDIKIVPAISLNVTDPSNGLEQPFRLNAWAISNTGYCNLLKLASMGWDSAIDDSGVTTSIIKIEDVIDHQEGVVFGTGCEKGLVGTLLLCSNDKKVEASKLAKIIGHLDRVVLELLPFDVVKYFDKGIGFRNFQKSKSIPDGNLTKAINSLIMDAVDSYGCKFIISTAAHFIDPDDKVFQDVVSKSSFKDKRFFYDTRYQRSLNECFAILKRHLGDRFSVDHIDIARATAEDMIEASTAVVVKHDYHLPKIQIPDSIVQNTSDYDKQLYLLLMAKIKEHGRWSNDPEYVARFKKELDVIWKNSKLNFIPYFLMYEDICAYARSQGILQNLARGSAGGCLISYYLKIIHIDPIKEHLPFERFLSHARINAGSFPDIDLDLGQRGPVLKYLADKYKAGFAQIGTFQRFKTKNAIKDAMFAVFGRNRADKEIMDVCDTIPDSPQGLDEDKFLYGYRDSEGVAHKGHLEQNETLQIFFKQYPEIEQITKKLIGLPKGMGRHASAFVISTLDLSSQRVPTMLFDDPDIGKVAVTQFEAPMVEKSGLVKADVLGLTTVKTLESVVSLIKTRKDIDLLEEDNKGVQFLYRLPEDNKVYEDFYKRKTDSSFQFNTDLIKGYIQKFAPTRRQDLSDLTALCRPGALDVEFAPGVSATQFYIDVRNGDKEPEYIHPDLADVLAETNGVVVYQEQLMSILVQFCGYSLEESDQIRSAIAKKKRDVMLKTFDRIRSETMSKGWTIEQANKLCDVVTAYSNYSFNRSHSRAYSELGYITMYLKHHYPLEWWAAELNNSEENKIRHYVTILGDKITPPSLHAPDDKFTIVGDRIAAPLSAVKGLGPSSIKAIIKRGPYSSVEDFILKMSTGVNSSHFWALLKAGVFDEMAPVSISIPEARQEFIKLFKSLKKVKTIPPEVNQNSPLDMFLNQRDIYKCFNKVLLADPLIRQEISATWPSMRETRRKDIPLAFGSAPTIPVISSIAVASKLIDAQERSESNDKIKVAMVGLFQSSTHRSGISKRGKPWSKVDIVLSDGLSTIECAQWDQKRALRYPTNSLVYVMGYVKRGWKGSPSIEVLEVERLVKVDKKSSKV